MKGKALKVLSVVMTLVMLMTASVHVHAIDVIQHQEEQPVELKTDESRDFGINQIMPVFSILGKVESLKQKDNFLVRFFRQLLDLLFGRKKDVPADKKEIPSNDMAPSLAEPDKDDMALIGNGTSSDERDIYFVLSGGVQRVGSSNEYNTTVGSEFTLKVRYGAEIFNMTKMTYGYGAVVETALNCRSGEWVYDYMAIDAIDLTVRAHGMYKTVDSATGETVCHDVDVSCVVHVKPSSDVPFGFRDVTKTELEIIHYYGSGESVSIPGQFKSYNITMIGQRAFANHTEVRTVTLPNGFKAIGNEAFLNCSSLRTVNGLNSVEDVSGTAFSGCPYIH